MKRQVTFLAKKSVKEPTVVHFDSKKGEILFVARKNIKKPVVVNFQTKKRK